MAYQSLIAKVSAKFKWPSWVVYDQNFRQDAVGNPQLAWAKVDSSTYAQCFTSQAISQENWCEKCQSLDHTSATALPDQGRGHGVQLRLRLSQAVTMTSARSTTASMVIVNLARSAGTCTSVSSAGSLIQYPTGYYSQDTCLLFFLTNDIMPIILFKNLTTCNHKTPVHVTA